MGVVWEAEEVATGEPVALKLLKRSGPDDSVARRFLREARAARAVRHPSIVRVHDVLELDDGSPVMVMELLTGETLAQRLTRQRVLALPEVARILVDVCAAVGCAHSLGIVHRDLKPENIFLTDSHGEHPVKVLDFGVAKLTASEGDAAHTGATTAAGVILGTLLYMSPEQILGEKDVDHRADIWALGAILYEALSGSRPIDARSVAEVYRRVITGAIIPLGERAPHVPAPIAQLVTGILRRDRAQRPSDVRELVDVLSAYAH
jgi:serine/threonine-protein kinase